MRVVDLFCGGGGLSHGLTQAGHEVVAAYDWWQPALDFYNRNIQDHHAYKLDLSNVAKSVAEIRRWKPDVIVGGPPCQDFSSAGKRDENGGRASLTISYARIVTAVRPKMFVMENVERAIKTKTYRNALRMFKEAGYELSVAVLDASLCGAPQARKRIVVVGGLKFSVAEIVDIYRANQAHSPLTVREYFGKDLNIDFYYRHPRSYARRGVFSVDEPSPTIRGVNRPIPQGYPGHSGDAAPITTKGLRPLTTRERSRIQTFPATWDLCGNKSDIEQIIGNAVPCALGEFVGRALVEFEGMPHHKMNPDVNSVPLFVQYEQTRNGDLSNLDLEPLDLDIVGGGDIEAEKESDYPPCQPEPAQMLLAVERKKARMTAKQKAKGFGGKKLTAKRPAKKSQQAKSKRKR